MEEEQFVFSNFNETPQLCQGLQTNLLAEKRCLNIPETISEHSSPSSNEDNFKINDPKSLIEHFSSDNRENIASNNSVISDESTVCATKAFNYSNIMNCEKKLLESSNDKERSFELEKKPLDREKCLQFSKKLKFLNDSVSTPPSVLREQISMLRREMNEAYEFHDLEIQILNEERKEDPENYAQLIEKYSTLLELYTSLKSEYEEYRREQEKVKYELQSKTVNCLESLCSQIESSDNSLSSASFISFNTDLKCSTMIGNFTESEAPLFHDVTFQTKDPLSDSDTFKTPKMSQKKINYEKRCRELEDYNFNLLALINSKDAILKELEGFKYLYETECEKSKCEAIKNEKTITNLKIEIDMLKEKYNEEIKNIEVDLQIAITAKEIISEELQHLKSFQKDYEEMKPQMKAKEELISNLQFELLSLKKSHDEEMQKFKLEKQEFEELCISLKDKNATLLSSITQKNTIIKDFEVFKLLHEKECENVNSQLEEKDNIILTLKAELDTVKEKYSEEIKKTEINLESSIADNKAILEELEHLRRFQKAYDEIIPQIKEKEEVISSLQNELLAIKKKYDEEVEKIKSEKIESEELRISLEDKNSSLLSLITTRDSVIKELEVFKSLHEKECEIVQSQLKEKDDTILNLKAELDTVKEKYSEEIKKIEENLETANVAKETILQELEYVKSIERSQEQIKLQIEEKELAISSLQNELLAIKKKYDEEVEKIKSEKIESEELCRRLEDKNSSLLTLITTKDIVIKDLEMFKLSHENEFEILKVKVIKNEDIIKCLQGELETVKEKYIEEIKKIEEDLETANTAKESISQELECVKLFKKNYEEIKPQLEEKEAIVARLQSDLLLSKENWNEEVEKIKYEKLELKELCTRLEIKNAELLSSITTKDSVIKELEVFKSLLEKECENVNLQLKEKDDIILTLKAELDTVKEKYSEEIKKTEINLETAVAANKTILEELEYSRRLQRDYEEMKPQIKEKEEAISSLQNELLAIKKKYDEDVEKIKSEKLESEELRLSLEDKNASLLSLISTRDSVIKELEVFKSLHEKECEIVQSQLKEKDDIILNLKAELDTVKEKYSEEIKKTEDLQTAVATKDAAIQELEYLKIYQKDYEEIKPQLTEKEKIISDLEIELLSLKNKCDEEIEKIKCKKAESEGLCMKLENENASLLSLITTKENLIKDLEYLKSSHENECEKLKLEVIKNQEYITNLKDELDKVKEKYGEEIKKIEIDLQATTADKETLLQELEYLKNLQNDYMHTKTQLKEKEEGISNLETKLISTKKNYDEELEKIKSEKFELEELCVTLEDKNASLLGLITTKDSVIKDLECLKSTHKNEYEKLKIEIIKNEDTIRSLTVELNMVKEKHSKEIKKIEIDLETAIAAKDAAIQELEYLKIYQKDYEQIKPQLKEKEERISNLEVEVLSIKKKCDEEIQNVNDRKVELEELCTKLEDKNASLLALILNKDMILKELEVFKSIHEKECENIKRQLTEKEEIILSLKAEMDTIKEKYREEVKNTEIESILTFLQVSCEKLRDILNSKNCSEMQTNDLLKFMPVSTETEDRILNQFMSAVFDTRNKLIQEWELQKNNDYLLIKELKNKISKLERLGPDFDNLIQGCEKLQEKDSEDEVLIEELAGLEKIKLSSVKEFPKIMKKVMGLVKKLQSRAAELKEENEKLDEECDSYANVIKDLKKEAAVEWKKNKEKAQVLESEIVRLSKLMSDLEEEKKKLLVKVSKLEEECQKLKANILPEGRTCGCGIDSKKVNELKRIILVKEQKLLELQELEVQNNSFKTQIEYLKNALDKERKKISEEKEKNKKLQNELNEAAKNQKTDNKKFEENQILEELRMRGTLNGGVVQEIVDKEKMRKLSKDVGVLKEICRARYAEIKRLEAENAALKNNTPKNSNQMDSPIRSRGYNTRSKSIIVEKWTAEMGGKENKVL